MSTISNSIKKAEKLSGGTVQIKDRLHFVNYKGFQISFFPNGRIEDNQATNFYTRRIDLQDDHQTDYFAGTFHDNITQCFKFVDYLTRNN